MRGSVKVFSGIVQKIPPLSSCFLHISALSYPQFQGEHEIRQKFEGSLTSMDDFNFYNSENDGYRGGFGDYSDPIPTSGGPVQP